MGNTGIALLSNTAAKITMVILGATITATGAPAIIIGTGVAVAIVSVGGGITYNVMTGNRKTM